MRPIAIALALVTAGAASAQLAAYPPYVTTKTLYADHDFRGKAAPTFDFGTWVKNPSPVTKGKVVLIDFWATWCPPCRELIPELNSLQAKFKNDLVVIGVSDETTEKLQKFMEGTTMDYSVSTDPNHHMNGKVGVKGIPHALVITPDGIVRWQGFPLDDKDPLTEAKLAQIIAAYKATPPPAAKSK